jgi:hypothetical protein
MKFSIKREKEIVIIVCPFIYSLVVHTTSSVGNGIFKCQGRGWISPILQSLFLSFFVQNYDDANEMK